MRKERNLFRAGSALFSGAYGCALYAESQGRLSIAACLVFLAILSLW